jgi:hypothetical protein
MGWVQMLRNAGYGRDVVLAWLTLSRYSRNIHIGCTIRPAPLLLSGTLTMGCHCRQRWSSRRSAAHNKRVWGRTISRWCAWHIGSVAIFPTLWRASLWGELVSRAGEYAACGARPRRSW